MYSRSLRTLLPLAAVVALVNTGFAQTTTATMTGVVTDATGAVVPDALVELTNPTTNVSFKATTNSAGSYRFSEVPPGPNYVLNVSHPGFAPLSVKGLYLNIANVRTQNATLNVGSDVQVDVQASGTSSTINTEDGSVGINYQVQKLNDLPIQDRSTPARLFTLQPGVTTTGSTTGARTDQNYVSVDGLDVNDFATGGGTTQNRNAGFSIVGGAPVDSVQEFRGTVGGFQVNSGPGSGGQFNLITRSGTNSFHGSLYEYHRDRTTVANDWFNKFAGVARPQLIRNQFGGSVGGPILHDRLFFFFNANYFRQSSSNPVARTVPLDSFRAGNVSYINNGPGCSRSSRQNTTPACISQLTPAQVKAADPANAGVNQALLTLLNSAYPRANDLTGGDGVNSGYFRFNARNINNFSQYVGRLDYTLTSRIKLRGVANLTRADSVNTQQEFPTLPVLVQPYSDRSYRWSTGFDWQIGANKFNQFTIGRVVQDVAFPITFNGYNPPTNPLTFNTGTTNLFDIPYNTPSNAQARRVPILQFTDDFNWSIGRHTIDIGGLFKYIPTSGNTKLDYATETLGLGGKNTGLNASLRPANLLPGSTTSTITYDSAFAAMLGRIGAIGGQINYDKTGKALPLATGSQRNYRYYQTEAYIGDTWKVTSDLTLTYGLNYQFFSVPYEVNGLESVNNSTFNDYFFARVAASAAGKTGNNAIPLQSYVLGGKANNGPNLYEPDWKNFAPRFAFAYNPSFDRDTVFRGSVGLVFDRTVASAVLYQQDQNSYLFQQPLAISNGVSGNPRAALLNDPRYGTAVTITPPATPASGFQPFVNASGPFGLQNGQAFNTTIDHSLKTPYSISTSFTMEHNFEHGFIFRGTYVGRFGRRLLGQSDSNQLIEFVDPRSGQAMSQAVGAAEVQARNNQPITPQPWFENLTNVSSAGYTSKTAAIVDNNGSLFAAGDFADIIQALSPNLPANVGMGAQYSANNYYTNRGFSTYHGALFSLQKNLSHGIQFDANYTWSHSIDNVSLIANSNGLGGTGLICDALRPRLCRASSDFDVTHLFNANFTYQLPFGRGRSFAGGAPVWLNEVIGGWDVSGIPSYRSGYAFTPVGDAFVASYSNNAPLLFNGDTAAIRRSVHTDPVRKQLTLFANPTAASGAFQGPIGFNIGSRNLLRGPGAFEFDAGLAKSFALYRDSVNLKFRADAFNVLNHPVFAGPYNGQATADINNGSQFGQITATTGTQPYRVLQLALRLEF
ncbi:carboxypeptidase-like regulatory domain-containing protein [Terriglobus aquaticus]|uniref:Carboxypeptidase-like regulatory domain-containing protein n=1 Tax=Terriglobus aquaticus TaxID=940139 RepID=A0ABW9KM35_9BACT|nr:carboxypeptidase-like regulatory domain-containing protein [Terriglobus aquaticus]